MRCRSLKKIFGLWGISILDLSAKLLRIWSVKMEWTLSLDWLFMVLCVLLNIAVNKFHTARNPTENGKPSTCLFGSSCRSCGTHCKGSHVPAPPLFLFYLSLAHTAHQHPAGFWKFCCCCRVSKQCMYMTAL